MNVQANKVCQFFCFYYGNVFLMKADEKLAEVPTSNTTCQRKYLLTARVVVKATMPCLGAADASINPLVAPVISENDPSRFVSAC